ncbi:MAG TPA: hypothetical protein VHE35_32995 [Kofleriaceae bacterium]|nr:hypothetical protein [Kofleriaceae bacterium]
MTPALATPRDTLAAFFLGVVDDPSEDGLAAQRAAHPDAPAAALSYLRDRHLAGVAPAEPWERTRAFDRVLRMILTAGGPDAARDLLALALRVTDLHQLRAVVELVVGVVTPDELATALIAALAPGHAPTIRATASTLAYHAFDALGDAYAPAPPLRLRLAALLAPA